MPTKIEKDSVTGTETTGHEWDGVRELNTPLPKWWIYTFYVCIAFAGVYMVLYPAVPWVNAHTGGILGYTQRDTVAMNLADAAARQGVFREQIAKASLEEIRKDPQLFNFATTGGRAVFNENCVPCHRAGGAGAKGFPNLADDDWLWGGSLAEISQTITHGVRNSEADSRQSQMPRFGADGILTPAQISDVADFVMTLSGGKAPAEAATRGGKLFADNCAACHGERGEGNREIGAKTLNNRIWLYGGDKATLVETITNARNSQMPAWGERFDATTIKMLTLYVHSLGGGE
jgi:cytochrome c oxidase cbb3-type subunit III